MASLGAYSRLLFLIVIATITFELKIYSRNSFLPKNPENKFLSMALLFFNFLISPDIKVFKPFEFNFFATFMNSAIGSSLFKLEIIKTSHKSLFSILPKSILGNGVGQ